MGTVTLLANAYVRTVNEADAAGFRALFAENARVDDNGRQLQGLAAIQEWADREIFGAQVSLDVLDVAANDDETLVTTIVNGNFDRTGLPDPVVISHRIEVQDGRIAGLTCRLCEKPEAARAGR